MATVVKTARMSHETSQSQVGLFNSIMRMEGKEHRLNHARLILYLVMISKSLTLSHEISDLLEELFVKEAIGQKNYNHVNRCDKKAVKRLNLILEEYTSIQIKIKKWLQKHCPLMDILLFLRTSREAKMFLKKGGQLERHWKYVQHFIHESPLNFTEEEIVDLVHVSSVDNETYFRILTMAMSLINESETPARTLDTMLSLMNSVFC